MENRSLLDILIGLVLIVGIFVVLKFVIKLGTRLVFSIGLPATLIIILVILLLRRR